MTDIIYTVEIHTGKKWGAGTDADVFITLYGEYGRSVEFNLDKKGVNNFEKGKKDVFDLPFPYNLGQIGKIRIRHDGTGAGAGWFLEKVTLKDSLNPVVYEFPCHRWLDDGEDDGYICRELICSDLDTNSTLFENLTTDAGNELYDIPINEKEVISQATMETESATKIESLEDKLKKSEVLIVDNNSNGSSSSCDTNDFMVVSKSDISMDEQTTDITNNYEVDETTDYQPPEISKENVIDFQQIKDDISVIDDLVETDNKQDNPFAVWQKNNLIESSDNTVISNEKEDSFMDKIENNEQLNKIESLIDNPQMFEQLEESDISINIETPQRISISEENTELASNIDLSSKEAPISEINNDENVQQYISDSVINALENEKTLSKVEVSEIYEDISSVPSVAVIGDVKESADEDTIYEDISTAPSIAVIDSAEEQDEEDNIVESSGSSSDEDIMPPKGTSNSPFEDSTTTSYVEVGKEDISVEPITIENIHSQQEIIESVIPVKEDELSSEMKHDTLSYNESDNTSPFLKVNKEDITLESTSDEHVFSNQDQIESVIPIIEDKVSSELKSIDSSQFIEVNKEDITLNSDKIEHPSPIQDLIEPVMSTTDVKIETQLTPDIPAMDVSSLSSFVEVEKEDVTPEVIEAISEEVQQAQVPLEHIEKIDSDYDSIEIIEAPTSLLAESIKEQTTKIEDDSISTSIDTTKISPKIEDLKQPIKDEPEIKIQPPVDILGNGKLVKTTISAGKGESTRPQPGDEVIISFEGTTEDGKVVDSDKECHLFVQEGDVILGLDLTVALMELGEISSVTVDSQFAYGLMGRTPDIQPNSNLKYRIELLDNLGSADFGTMPFKRRMEIAEQKRNRGNELFNRQDYGAAISSYTSAQNNLEQDSKLSEAEKFVLDQCLVKCLNNQAICQLKIDAYDAALKTCESVLKTDPKNVKAMFRKGKAQNLKGDYINAVKSLSEAFKLDPSNKEIAKELKEAKDKLTAEDKKCKDMYQKMLGTETKETSSSQSNPAKTEGFPMWAICSGTAFAAGILVISWALYQLFDGDD